MDEHEHHEQLIEAVKDEYEEVFNLSEQAIYVYLDDNHKVCNKNFSDLLGYKNPEEWASVTESFPDAFVAEKSQETLVSAYMDAMEKLKGTKISVVWKKKDGSTVDTNVVLVPIPFKGHLFALHFISTD